MSLTAAECWEVAVRRKMDLPAGASFDVLEEPRRTWAYYMLGAVERGRGVITNLQAHGWQPGVRFLDAGCAYGGHLVAASQAGASRVVGVDVDANYLALARELLASHGVEGRLEEGSIDERRVLDSLCSDGLFDVITCTDVLEHVDDAASTLEALSSCLAPGGTLYITVPNFRNPDWVKADPHFGIAGITLLPHDIARSAAFAVHPWLPRYSVGDYHPLAWYRERLSELGMQTWLLNAGAGTLQEQAGRVRRAAMELCRLEPDSRLPDALAERVRTSAAEWANELLSNVSAETPDPLQLDEYAVQTWELLAVNG
ncbi:class I SAM-dependent methyltransferase [Lysobacter claricitrinus]|uniref:class I SAM-dependent methyltransferase n=1 Tax=Lysobacter claricitrinus TaxID=3367728 RepID=UPI0037DB924C